MGASSLAHGCLQTKYAAANLLLPTQPLLGNSADAAELQAPIVEQFVSAPLPRAPGLPLVDDWDCLRVRSLSPQPHTPMPLHLSCQDPFQIPDITDVMVNCSSPVGAQYSTEAQCSAE